MTMDVILRSLRKSGEFALRHRRGLCSSELQKHTIREVVVLGGKKEKLEINFNDPERESEGGDWIEGPRV